ncbi:MAG: FUSC family protein [Flavobacteriaceae bacterium]
MSSIDSFLNLFRIPNLHNRFYVIRSLRLSFILILSLWLGPYLDLSSENAFALFSSVLFLAISDMVCNISTRYKMLVIVTIGLILMTLLLSVFNTTHALIIIFIGLLVRESFTISFRFPEGNLFFTIMLLGFSFYLPLKMNFEASSEFSLFLLLGGILYLLSLFIGHRIYVVLERRKDPETAKLFYVEGTNLVQKTSFIVSRKEALKRRSEDLNSEYFHFFTHPYRLVLSMTLAYVFSVFLDLHNSYWIMLTVIIVHNPSQKISAGIPKIMKRFFGTVIGLILCIGLIRFDLSYSVLLIIVGLSSFLIFLCMRHNYFMAVIFITLLVMTSIKLSMGLDQTILEERFIDTMIAICIVLASHLIMLSLERLFASTRKPRSY